MKRLSIAVEILNMPSLIFLDEPTSGLDSVMAYEVMSFTAKLAEQNRTIITTVHQVRTCITRPPSPPSLTGLA